MARKLLAAVGASAAIAGVWGAPGVAGAQNAPRLNASVGSSTASPPSPTEIARYERSLFGLPNDDATLTAMAASTIADTSTLGIPLTAAEAVELHRRDRVLQQSQSTIDLATQRLGGAYAGFYQDQQAEGALTFLYADSQDHSALAQELEAIAPPTAVVVLRQVAYPMTVLKSAEARLEQARQAFLDKGIDVVESGVRVPFNTFYIGISTLSPSGSEDVLLATLGPGVTVGRSAGGIGLNDRLTPYPHIRGGLGITDVWKAGGRCTANISGISSGQIYYVLTAGHCSAGTGDTWWEGASGHNGTPVYIGTSGIYNGEYTGSRCDCIAIGSITAGQATNVVYITSTSGWSILRNMTSAASDNAIGKRSCYSGAGAAWQGFDMSQPVYCGIVAFTGQAVTDADDGVTIYDLDYMTAPLAIGGDSGAPVYTDAGSELEGVLRGTVSGYNQFSTAYNVYPYARITPITWQP